MNPVSLNKKFVFNDAIDTKYLFSLYENDYVCISDIFATTLASIDEDIESLEQAYFQKNIPALKRAVHKLKPVYGFTGMLRIENLLEDFGQQCEKAANTDQLRESFRSVMQQVLMGKMVMEEEYKRLALYIQ